MSGKDCFQIGALALDGKYDSVLAREWLEKAADSDDVMHDPPVFTNTLIQLAQTYKAVQ